jgi:outer membrane protein OmpA-like peptidoglycan-associated protein
MKKTIILFSVLLLVWVAGSSYVYVCKIQNDCSSERKADNDSLAVGEAGNAFIDTLQTKEVVTEIPVPDRQILYFDLNKCSCEITTENTSHFQLIKEYLAVKSGKKVRVTGHSDSSGSELSKEKISAQRAEFIKDKLIEAGVPADAIETIAESDHTQEADNSTAEGRAKNRRTEILIK